MKNLFAKRRDASNPYKVYANALTGWSYSILKLNTSNTRKEYASAFCFVKSPYCPDGELGDTYIADIEGFRHEDFDLQPSAVA